MRCFGWKKDRVDDRDYQYEAKPIHAQLGDLDLRPYMAPVYDQGATSSCVANAVAAALEYNRSRQSLPSWTPSRLFIYYQARVFERCSRVDAGCEIRDAIKTAAHFGIPPETSWPFDPKKVNRKPDDSAWDEALHSKLIQYARVPLKLNHITSCLAHEGPVLFGSSVFKSIDSEETARTGIIPMPSETDVPIGGHAMLICGFLPETETFIIRNSWGDSWGDNGYGYMPAEYLLNPDLTDDLWVTWMVART